MCGGGGRSPQLSGREGERRLRDSVVRPRGHDAAGGAGGVPRDPPRQVVRLAAGVHEQNSVEPSREGGQQPLGQLDGSLLQVPAVGVQRGQLRADRVDHRRVGVPQHRHVVVGVEVAAPVRALEEHPAAAHQMHRLGVADLQPAQHLRARAEQVGGGPPVVGQPAPAVRRLDWPVARAEVNRAVSVSRPTSSMASSWSYASSSISGAEPSCWVRQAVIRTHAA